MKKDYDILVIGGGPAGYIAASYATQYEKKVALIEKSKLGGCCLNVGCIPTKILAEAANRYSNAGDSESFGVVTSKISFYWDKLKLFSENTREDLSNGVRSLLKKRKVDVIDGNAKVCDQHTVNVDGKTITAKNIILATGSKTSKPKAYASMDKVLTSDTFWSLETIPKSLLIVGGGVIGCEIASALNRLGTKVYIAEQMPRLMMQFGEKAVDILTQQLEKDGVSIFCCANVSNIYETTDGLTVMIGDNTIDCEFVLWSTGRVPENIETGNTDIELTESGFIKVDEHYKTNIGNIFAIGDANGKTLLAHAAMYQAMRVVEYICMGQDASFTPCIPQCVYTYPPIAKIGLSKEECVKKGLKVVSGSVPYYAVGYSRAIAEEKGYIEVIRNISTDTLEGAEIAGQSSYELIHILAPYVDKKIPLKAMQDIIFSHPTLCEGIKIAIELTYTKSPQI